MTKTIDEMADSLGVSSEFQMTKELLLNRLCERGAILTQV
jgi:hypothetical protein